MQTKPKLEYLFRLAGILVLTAFLYASYRLVVVPATLDFSYVGVLGLALACLIGVWVLPKRIRRSATLYAASILMMLYGFQNVYYSSWFYQILSFVVIVAFFGIVLKRFADIRFIWTAVTGLIAVLLIIIMPMDKLPLYSKFTVPYRTPNLVDSTSADFPIYPEHATEGTYNTGETVTTFTNRPFPPITRDDIKPKRDTMLISFALDGGKTQLNYLKADQLSDTMVTDIGTAGFPYHTYSLSNVKGFVQADFNLTSEPEQLAQNLLNLGSFPLSQDQLENQTVQSDQNEWSSFQASNTNTKTGNAGLIGSQDTLTIQDHEIKGTWNGHTITIPTDDSKVLGVAHVVKGQGEQVLAEGSNRIDVYDLSSGKKVSTYQSTVDVPLPGSIVAADIDGDGQDEILLNTVPAQIIKLMPNGTWKTLWVSGRTSFRFECAGKLGNDAFVTIVANSPGYRYANGTLERLWRISKGNFVLASLVKEKGSTQNDLMLTDYGSQKITIARPHDIPVQGILYALFGVYVVVSFVYFKRWRRGQYV
jgi:hypothetical protein